MGKMILLVVLGSYMVIGVLMQRNSLSANDAVDNVIEYYGRANSRHIASSGANMAVGNIFRDPTWRTGYTNLSFSNGIINVRVNADTSLGVNGIRIIAASSYLGFRDTAVVEMNLSYYSKYLMYVNSNPTGGLYVTGDTIDGPFHTNDYLSVGGSPVFKGRVTMGKGPYKGYSWNGRSANPQFFGGYEYGVNVSMPATNFSTIETSSKNEGYYHQGNSWITMDGSNSVRIGYSEGSVDSVVPLSSLAQGLICIKGNVHIKGKINGSLTVAAINSSSSNSGNVWLDDDIGVVVDPRTNTTSTQYLGIVSQKKVVVTDTRDTHHYPGNPNGSDIAITASLYCGAQFSVENYDSKPNSGYIRLYGSMTQNTDGYTGAGGSGTVSYGYNLNYKYDGRLLRNAPPRFPLTDRMQILSWWE